MSSVIYKNLNSPPNKVTSAEGVWLDIKGKGRILDTCGGVAVSSLGHCHPRIIDAMLHNAIKPSWVHAGSFTTDSIEHLSDFLTNRTNNSLKHIQFLSGGSEAMEVALKVAYQFHFERGEKERTVFISRKQSYHGSTLGTLSISGNKSRRAIFQPFLFETKFVSPCYSYRYKHADETDLEYAERLAIELEQCICELGEKRVAAFIAEPVVGSTLGAVPPVEHYFREIKKVCEHYGVLLILDDIMSGMGRIGELYSHNYFDVTPDIVTIGKGLAAGYQPISGYLISDYIYNVIKNNSGFLLNGQTHVNHPYACAIALEVQKVIEEDNLLKNVRLRGEELHQGLNELAAKYDFIGDVRGVGLFQGIEFVTDKQTHRPLQNGENFVANLKAVALEEQLLIYPNAGTVDGQVGAHILLAPPFISSPDEISEMLYRLDRVFSNLEIGL